MRKFKKEAVPVLKNLPEIPLGFKEYVLEIGAGCGQHAEDYAMQNPEHLVLAVERTKEKYRKFYQRLKAKEAIPNLILIHGDAINVLVSYNLSHFFQRIFLLYPNPEPKNKNQRWIHMPFFSYLWASLKKEGQITMATNIEDYAEEFSRLAHECWQLDLVLPTLVPDNQQRTLFEKKYQERGEPCWEVVLRKNRV